MMMMLVDATLLIQDIQLLCFTIVFGVLAFQRWGDRTRRWLWYSFLANAAGAIFDLLIRHLPAWIGYGVNVECYPLSYAVLNVALVYFDRHKRTPVWLSGVILFGGLPFLLAWCKAPSPFRSNALGDLMIALECVITIVLLLRGKEQSTRAPRILMAGFLVFFVGVEAFRFFVAFPLHTDPASWPKLEVTSAVTYIVDVSLLPLAFIWMMNARLEWDLLQQSIVDALTRVLNRRGLEQALERELARFRRYGEDLTVAMLDLDHFKLFNDKYGHAVGDTILIGVAELLSSRLRETDVVGRFGGEEFIVLLPHTDIAESAPILEHLCESIRESSDFIASAKMQPTASFGATSTQGRRAITGYELLREADIALYQAKEQGRDQVCFFSPPDPVPLSLRSVTSITSAG
jgi:diguanylate cyclase (GGDEF)-like protein